LECLGDGSYGWVWRATNLPDDKVVAVKIPKQMGRSDEELAEGSALVGRPSHPNVVEIYWMGRVPPQREWYAIEMEYFPSSTLAHLLDVGEQGLVLRYDKVLDLFAQVLEGVKHLHRLSIAHRDIKPQNILVSGERLKLTDFGSSFMPEELYARTRENGGTILYSAPEVVGVSSRLRDEEAYFRADIYSLGVLLYHLVTSRLPHDTLSQVARHQPFPRPSELNSTVSPQLEQLIMKCLDASPENRWNSAQELAQAYHAVRQSQKAYGEIQRLIPYSETDIDWSTDAVQLLGTEDYQRAGQIARQEYERSQDKQAFLIMVKALIKEERYFDCIDFFKAHPEILKQTDYLGGELRRQALTVYLKTRHISDASQVLKICLKDDPDAPDLLLKKASVLGLQARYKEASEILLTLNRKFPNKPAILKRLALVFEQLRDEGKAAAFKRAYEKHI
jgi:serine/threonine-protein kinase